LRQALCLPQRRIKIMSEEKKLNPQIMDVEIGIREMRKIKIYPLSMADQLKLTDVVMKSVAEQLEQGGGDLSIATFVIRLIQENIVEILKMATDEEGEKVTSEISNSQAIEIAEILFDVNYGAVSKNFKSLSKKVGSLFQQERPLPQSANDTATDSTISTEKATEKEE